MLLYIQFENILCYDYVANQKQKEILIMKKLFAIGPKKCELREVEMPVIEKSNQVIVKLKYCGVCRSEHYDWENAKEGMSFGHEPFGIICEVGSGVKNYKIGDRVSGLFSGSAEYALVSESNLVKIPDNVTDEQAIAEPLGCLISAISKVRIPLINTKVGVVGCGYMGCGAISLLKMRGAYVVAVDINEKCLEDAKKYGADEVYTPDNLPAKYVTVDGDHNDYESASLGKRGFDLVMEWAETNESLDLAINMTAECGQIAVGAYHTGEKRLVNVQQLGVKAIDMLNTHPREWNMLSEGCANGIDLFARDAWSFKNVPTKVWPISRFDDAQREITEKYGCYMKSIVDWTKTEGEPYIVG